jgi:hypothetical protein
MGDGNGFLGLTFQFAVPDIREGIKFYSRLFRRPPDFEPHDDFKEWKIIENCTFQLGLGEARPTHAMRFRVDDLNAERRRIEREVGAKCLSEKRIPGLVTLCNFSDPWGNVFGIYQRTYVETPAVFGGSWQDNKKYEVRFDRDG